MTHSEKLGYMKLAFSIQNIGLKQVDLDIVLQTYELIIKKEGNVNIKDLVKLKLQTENKYLEKEAEKKAKTLEKVMG